MKPINGYLDVFEVMGDDGWFGMDITDARPVLIAKGYCNIFVSKESINRSNREIPCIEFVERLKGERTFQPWTIFDAVNWDRSDYDYHFFFTNPEDAVYARLLLS